MNKEASQMIPNEIANETQLNTNVININTSNNQTATRSINSSQSNRLERKNRFNLPGDQAYQQSSLLSNSQSNKIQVQSTKNKHSSQDRNLNASKEKKIQQDNLHIKEEAANELSSICNSVYSKKEYQTNQNYNNQDASPNKARVLYGSQIIQVRQSQQQIVEQMNCSMQSFHSKKSKDLQVYSAQDNKMLILEVKNPENIEKLKLKIEQDEQNKLNSGIKNKSQINVQDNNKEQLRQQDDQNSVLKETNNVLSCKICLEEGDSEKQGKIFTPCQCTGTCKWIHEECLKEWIISRYVHLQTSNNPRDFLKAECEICKYKYNMKFETQHKFYKNNVCTKNGKKNFITCLCSMLCIVAYIVCMLFFLVINNSSSGSSSNSNNQNNSNSNQNNQGNVQQSSSSSSNVQSYQYALIIVCSLLILLSLIVCIVSARQAFFRRSISRWLIFKYDPILNKVQNNNQSQNNNQKQQLNNQNSNQQPGYPPNDDRNLRFYYNGQVFNTNLRDSVPVNQQRYHVRRQVNPNRNNSMRREPSTQDQSQLFNLRNSDLAARQNQQNLILVQDQNALQSNRVNVENDEAMSQNVSARQVQNNEIVRVDNNRYNVNIDDESFEYFNNSQDMVVYQFNNNNNNQRQSNFNLADNY
ncbi:zinc finger protein (macronuclear) [Tetrahymena thermophila SB210]|uniref:Zinc finger protein n=1 Tax=Tetrahymena thermophila (strain SB210) TaxID=312017 RepID=I7MJ08_TETTS|nr:zinc finger protein [Tetrahymena thermophila SB210]EAS04922.1 zinc finger protein [Tetrahymena thermophila SB210]|eukprot:XP_001025167.1 zinc finger protein [Tetrahymena thermophila SB210]